mgnify:CR=1 FL=1|tara:strand:+ start:51 stop:383 length:333 start_codon:yes stop_codon:yes gene_type:complete
MTHTTTKLKVKTIDLQAKEWFDKINGNSYFSVQVTINFGLPTQKNVYVPFQYGYGDHYLTETANQLQTDGILPNCTIYNLKSWCKDNNIQLRFIKIEKCLQRDVKSWGSN